jgi:hypothetical protein
MKEKLEFLNEDESVLIESRDKPILTFLINNSAIITGLIFVFYATLESWSLQVFLVSVLFMIGGLAFIRYEFNGLYLKDRWFVVSDERVFIAKEKPKGDGYYKAGEVKFEDSESIEVESSKIPFLSIVNVSGDDNISSRVYYAGSLKDSIVSAKI